MKYKINIKDMLSAILVVVVVTMIILMGLDYLGIESTAPIEIPSLFSSDENTSMSPSGAMSGTIN